ATMEVELEAARRERSIQRDGGFRPRMEHDRGVDVLEDARVDHVHLAARVRRRAFFSRRAEDPDRTVEVAEYFLERQPSADGRRADEVVTAAVTQPGQRVVLGQNS